MENYEKGEVKELGDHVNMQCVLENAVLMNVNAGSKIHNLMKFAEKKMNVRVASLLLILIFIFLAVLLWTVILVLMYLMIKLS